MQITTVHNVESKTAKWMKCPSIQIEFPGLAFIYPLDQLIVAEERDTLHDIIGLQGKAYTIFNGEGEKVFLAVLKKRFRKFQVKIFNNYGNEVIHVNRPYRLCANRVLVWAPPGNFMGSVKELRFCHNTYIVKNQTGKSVLKIIADGMCQFVYKINMVYGGRAIGIIKKQCELAAVANVKNFGVSFPAELDFRDKTVLLGACFLIGYLKY